MKRLRRISAAEATRSDDWMTICRECGISFQDLLNWYEQDTGINLKNSYSNTGKEYKDFVKWVQSEIIPNCQ